MTGFHEWVYSQLDVAKLCKPGPAHNPNQLSRAGAAVSMRHELHSVARGQSWVVPSGKENICFLTLGLHCHCMGAGKLGRIWALNLPRKMNKEAQEKVCELVKKLTLDMRSD